MLGNRNVFVILLKSEKVSQNQIKFLNFFHNTALQKTKCIYLKHFTTSCLDFVEDRLGRIVEKVSGVGQKR